ncbi:MAG: DUF1642 domain-containing protein [Furfurilactobacillus sp.]|jgi:hypothetical protein|uniref:DUF1642 domain-containing protein n=1 Tax=Furfurilactobacillus sp. TaxID=2767911 RepID=UPI00258B8D7E|nr:DUF1642 domain-containing protein [Furfurilactobacillus sp.]MCH4010571.1 DUF1642 domain-containing protein [Furfurilactobacillus sp.]MCH4036463.1 DUF1642 domain-containing protein [Furfurilactobacillus sp.]MCH4114591.1 DUF1642 domain-containing protein [Furfurilactobacillus sp.]MCH4133790.1 DUF1642 domain-containing protein [Furfurilactobacillus sp.]MCI1340173.1 DUF1642 domain-containing protein [Furfurilactobacillus sp.]
MSEEKLYAVKNDEGKYWELSSVFSSTTNSKEQAKLVADEHGGHVVTLIEEPEKAVLTNEQAKIIEKAHNDKLPACYISSKSDDEELLMKAYVNGYTVEKDKKYNVKVPYAVNSYFKKIDANDCIAGDTFYVDLDEDLAQFTESEIEQYGLQDCERKEVTDDDD